MNQHLSEDLFRINSARCSPALCCFCPNYKNYREGLEDFPCDDCIIGNDRTNFIRTVEKAPQ